LHWERHQVPVEMEEKEWFRGSTQVGLVHRTIDTGTA